RAAASQVRGSSSRAKGLPWLSVMIWSQTAASSGPGTLPSSSERASLSPSPPMGNSGSPARTSSPTPGRAPAARDPRALAGARVEPLGVLDHADQRLSLGDLGHQRQGGQPDREPVGDRPGAQPENGGQGGALGGGEARG